MTIFSFLVYSRNVSTCNTFHLSNCLLKYWSCFKPLGIWQDTTVMLVKCKILDICIYVIYKNICIYIYIYIYDMPVALSGPCVKRGSGRIFYDHRRIYYFFHSIKDACATRHTLLLLLKKYSYMVRDTMTSFPRRIQIISGKLSHCWFPGIAIVWAGLCLYEKMI